VCVRWGSESIHPSIHPSIHQSFGLSEKVTWRGSLLDDKPHSKIFLNLEKSLLLFGGGGGVCERGLLDEKYHSKRFS